MQRKICLTGQKKTKQPYFPTSRSVHADTDPVVHTHGYRLAAVLLVLLCSLPYFFACSLSVTPHHASATLMTRVS